MEDKIDVIGCWDRTFSSLNSEETIAFQGLNWSSLFGVRKSRKVVHFIYTGGLCDVGFNIIEEQTNSNYQLKSNDIY